MVLLALIAVILCSGLLVSASPVIEVNITNIFNILDSSPALLEFYAPWCAACARFERSYEGVAKQLKLANPNFVVGRIDMAGNPALASMFSVEWIPVFYLYRDNKIYRLREVSTSTSIVQYCQEGYLSDQPLSDPSSPLGSLGRIKGLMLRIGLSMYQTLQYLCDDLGLQFWQAILMSMVIGAGVIAAITGVVILLALRFKT